MPRSWPRRATSWFAGVLTACSVLLACDSITNPGDDAVIVITYDNDTTVVVGTTIVPRFSVTVDGVVAPQPRLVLSSSNLSVISVSATGDSLFVNARGFAAITATLIGSTLADDPPAGSRTLHAVAAELHIAEHGVELDALGDTTTCRAVALGASGDTLSNVQATWFSADDSVASVNASGRVTANRNGSTEVFAIVDNDTASVGVSVAQRLAGFGFEPAPVILNSLGATAQLAATPRDAGDAEIPSGVVPDPAWSTANPGIASVTSEGLVTAVGNGETYIRAAGLDIVDSVRTEVRQVATRVSIFGPRAIELDAIGDSVRLSAAGFDALDADVLVTQPTWISRDLAVAQVEPSTGIVRALDVGITTIVARVDTAADSVTVTVRNVPTSLDLTPDTLRFVSLEDTTIVQSTIRNKFDAVMTDIPIAWAIVDAAVATVESDGSTVAHAIGTTQLIGSLDNGVADTTFVIVENLPVTVNIVPLEATLASIGDTLRLGTDIRNSRGAVMPPSVVTWTSDDATVATTSSSGLVTARGRGEVFVLTTNPYNASQRDSALVQVTNAPELVTLSRSADTLTALTLTLEYQAVVENARGATIPSDEEPVEWRSLDESIAMVNSVGLATATGVGTTRIVARAGTGASLRADTASLTVFNTAVSLRVSPSELTVASVGGTAQLSVTALNDVGGEVTGVDFGWTSSDIAVAEVSSSGLVTSQQVGTTTITVTLGDLSASASITVTNAPSTVEIIPDSYTLASINDSYTPAVNFRNALDSVLDRTSAEWLSDDALVAIVTSEGIITATGRGTTRIRARNPLNFSRTDLIEIAVTNAPDSIELNRTDDALPSLDRTLQYAATVWNARGDIINDAVVTWTSLNTSVATITAGGLARSVGIGESQIVGRSEAVADTARLVVSNLASQVTISPSPVTLTSEGATQPLNIVALNELGNQIANPTIICESSNESIATVDTDCVVTAVSVGGANIDATVDAVTSTVVVNVSNDPSSVNITPGSHTLEYVGETYLVDPVEFLNTQGDSLGRDAVSWATSNPSVATVSDIGMVTAVGRGDATIRATSPAAGNITDVMTITVTNAPTTVTLDRGNTTLTAYGATVGYGADVRNVNGDLIANEPVTWSSSDGTVATITQGGVATAVGRGITTITAECTDYAGITNVPVTLEVTNNAVSITVTPGSATIMDLGSSYQLSAVALNDRGDALAEAGDISWSSLDENIATVDANGFVTATNNPDSTGTVGIVATAVYGGQGAQSAVTVHNSPRTVLITSPDPTALYYIGDTITVAATIQNLGGADLPASAVEWASSAPQIATVDENGEVTAHGVGNTEIRATSPLDGSYSDAFTVTVSNEPSTITIDRGNTTLTAYGETLTYSAEVQNINGDVISSEPVTWSSTDETVATISQAGIAAAVGRGSTTITVECTNYPSVSSTPVTLDVSNDAVSITVTPTSAEILDLAGTYQLNAAAFNDRGDAIVEAGDISWSSLDTDIATVDAATGLVTATSNTADIGTVRIVATANYGGLTAQSTVSVSDAPRTIDITSPNTTLDYVGDTLNVAATIQNLGGIDLARTAVTWASTAPQVATIDGDGDVIAQGVGIAVISATSPYDASLNDQFTITVENNPATLELNTTAVTISALLNTSTLEAIIRNANGEIITGHTVLWSTDDGTVATVSGGVVTAEGVGGATISAAVTGFPLVNDAAAITVTNNAQQVLILPSSVEMTSLGEDATVSVTAYNSRGDVITNPTVAWVPVPVGTGIFSISSSTGESIVATAEADGAARLRATVDGVYDTIWVTVMTDDDASFSFKDDR